MLTSQQCQKKYGAPAENNPCMTLWDVPTELETGIIPNRLYTNKDMIKPLSAAFKNLIDTGALDELKTWDGCFNIRKKRGLVSLSLHSWGVAVDVNAFSNGLGKKPTLSAKFVKCFTDAGFEWGGYWKTRPDGMHFQLATI